MPHHNFYSTLHCLFCSSLLPDITLLISVSYYVWLSHLTSLGSFSSPVRGLYGQQVVFTCLNLHISLSSYFWLCLRFSSGFCHFHHTVIEIQRFFWPWVYGELQSSRTADQVKVCSWWLAAYTLSQKHSPTFWGDRCLYKSCGQCLSPTSCLCAKQGGGPWPWAHFPQIWWKLVLDQLSLWALPTHNTP